MAKRSKALESSSLFPDEENPAKTEWIDTAARARQRLEALSNPYIGNKRKILIDIAKFVYDNGLSGEMKDKMVLDLFSGSASVSFLFKSLGFPVWSNDILYSSCLFAVSHVANQSVELTDAEWDFLLHNQQSATNEFVQSRYVNGEDAKFSAEEAKFLDNFYWNVNDLINKTHGLWLIKEGDTNPYAADYAEERCKFSIAMSNILGYVMDRCQVGGRLNHGQVFANFEHRLSHDRNTGDEMKFKLTPSKLKIDGPKCIVTCSDSLALLSDQQVKSYLDQVGLIYIDPPYGGGQSDYPFMYSFSEEYVRQTDFEKIEELSARKYTKANGYAGDFTELLQNLPKGPAWLFSYNDDSWADIGTIMDLIKKFKSNVVEQDIDYSYNQRKDRRSSSEYLILAR